MSTILLKARLNFTSTQSNSIEPNQFITNNMGLIHKIEDKVLHHGDKKHEQQHMYARQLNGSNSMY